MKPDKRRNCAAGNKENSKMKQAETVSKNAPFQPDFSGIFPVWVASGSMGRVHEMGHTLLPTPKASLQNETPILYTLYAVNTNS